MVKNITEYTRAELEEKIEAIKAERERTAEALKKYEAELERRKQEGPLGVPLKGTLNEMPLEVVSRGFLEWFSSEESADKFADYFYKFEKALQDIAEGKPIDIKVLLPLLRKGWVAMDKNGDWHWYKERPYIENYCSWNSGSPISFIGGFNIKPAEGWCESLMECGL